MLFKADSGQEIFTQVTRITADRASSRAFAAEMLQLGEARGAAVAAANEDGGAAGGAMLGEGGGGSSGSLGGEASTVVATLGGYGGGDPLGAFGDRSRGRVARSRRSTVASPSSSRSGYRSISSNTWRWRRAPCRRGRNRRSSPVAAPAANLGGGSARMRSSSSLGRSAAARSAAVAVRCRPRWQPRARPPSSPQAAQRAG